MKRPVAHTHGQRDGEALAAVACKSRCVGVAVKDGKWSDPGTWRSGAVPELTWDVEILADVEYDVDPWAGLKPGHDDWVIGHPAVVVRSHARLRHSPDRDTFLGVGTLLVLEGGAYECGTAEAPIPEGTRAELAFAPAEWDKVLDPEQLLGGLLAWGDVSICGAEKTPFVRPGWEPIAGKRAMSCPGAKGWRKGDRLAFPPSGGPTQWAGRRPVEVRIVDQPGDEDTSILTMDTPLAGVHEGARDADGNLDFLPHVANLSRNVVVRSLRPGVRRGHCMWMGVSRPVLRFGHYLDLGRTSRESPQIGRYPVHCHVLGGAGDGKAPRFVVEGCVVEDSRKGCIRQLVVHSSHGGLVRGNVLLGSQEVGVFTEVGDESHNTFEGNLVMDTGGDAYWMRGLRNYWRGNVAAGCTGKPTGVFSAGMSGFYLAPALDANLTHTAPLPGGGEETFRDVEQTFLEFAGNEAYSCKYGFYPDHSAPLSTKYIDDLRCWSCWGEDSDGSDPPAGSGARHYDSGTLVYRRPVFRGCSLDHVETTACEVHDPDIQMCERGVHDLANSGTLTVEGGVLRNRVNVRVCRAATFKAGELPPGGVAKETHLRNIDSRPVGRPDDPTDCWHLDLAGTPDGGPSQVPLEANAVTVEDCFGLEGRHRLYRHGEAAPAGAVEAFGVYGLVGPEVKSEPE